VTRQGPILRGISNGRRLLIARHDDHYRMIYVSKHLYFFRARVPTRSRCVEDARAVLLRRMRPHNGRDSARRRIYMKIQNEECFRKNDRGYRIS